MGNSLKTIFLDRDGVINEDRIEYVTNLSELTIFPFVPEAIARLNRAGYRVIVISNQQGIAKKVVTEDDLKAISENIQKTVQKSGGEIAHFYYCKHLKEDMCNCRKPKAGLIHQAALDLGIKLEGCYLIGDTEKDLIAARSAGCTPILVLSGHTQPDMIPKLSTQPAYVAANLAEAVDWVLQ
jgi:D-glycero-D-manno-heptose 1,7-bisphosphate phosphatase